MLRRTLCSLRNQTVENYRVVVAIHDMPEIADLEEFPNVVFETVEFPPGAPLTKQGLPACTQRDRNWKVIRSLVRGRSFEPQYAMQLDADDWLHKDLFETVLADRHPAGYVLDRGYEICWRRQRAYSHGDLSKRCGSTFILRVGTAVYIPESLDMSEQIKCLWLKYNHKVAESYLQENSRLSLARIDREMAAWVVNHGGNDHTLRRLARVKSPKDSLLLLRDSLKETVKFDLAGKKLTPALLDDFGQLQAV